MQGREAVEATEVCHVQCKDMPDAVNIHGRCQSCIVNLNSRDTVLYDNLAPLAVGALVFRQQAHALLRSQGPPAPLPRRTIPIRCAQQGASSCSRVPLCSGGYSTALCLVPPGAQVPQQQPCAVDPNGESCEGEYWDPPGTE